MAFRFTLDSVLRLRRSVEHQQELLLHSANNNLAEVCRKIDSLGRVVAHLRDRREREMSTTVAAYQLQFEEICDSVLAEYRRQLESDRLKAEETCAQQAEAFRKAHRDREILDTLRQNDFRDYWRDQDRRRQRELDDLLLTFHERGRRG